jgi:putative FmdB family regulatory protein
MIRDYRCDNCGKTFQRDVPVTSKLEGRKVIKVRCGKCNSTNVVRIFTSPPSIIFKGTGFYTTDKDK